MSYENLKNEENEILSADEQKICQMLGELKRAEAPKDFDFRLKARIANAKPEDFRKSSWLSVLRYAAPLGLVLVVLAVWVAGGLYSVDNNSAPDVVVDNFVPPKTESNTLSAQNAVKPIEQILVPNLVAEAANSENQTVKSVENGSKNAKPETSATDSVLTRKQEKRKVFEPKTENNSGGSKDFALTKPLVLTPTGTGGDNPLAVKAILSFWEIDAVFAGNQWKINSVGATAEKSGLKPNDFIEAIDGIKLTGETITGRNTFSGVLTILRGKERMEIKITK